MTLPEQSNRAIAQAREFLVRLASPYGEAGIKGIRREVRAEASRMLRHYPYSKSDEKRGVPDISGGWISVAERLPEGPDEVLVYWIPRDDDGTPSCAGCDNHGGIISLAWLERIEDDPPHWVGSCQDEAAPDGPLFWMPMPLAPEVTP